MYAAKESQTGSLLYTPEHDRHSLRRLNLLSDVRRAIESTEVIVHYQPMVRLDDMSVHGAEALVRWQHPTFGLLPPSSVHQGRRADRADPSADATRARSRDRAVRGLVARRPPPDDGGQPVGRKPDGSGPSQRDRADARRPGPTAAGVAARVDREHDHARSRRRPLDADAPSSRLGVRISVDDFGTGFSSLEKLQRLPIDELKIDQTFVTQMLHDESNLIIVRSVVNLGHDLGLKVIAEGVEDEATLRQLTQTGMRPRPGLRAQPASGAAGVR